MIRGSILSYSDDLRSMTCLVFLPCQELPGITFVFPGVEKGRARGAVIYPSLQGNDRGSQYRSGLYLYTPQQQEEAEESRKVFQDALDAKGKGKIVTEIIPAPEFYYAEDYHQQYEAKPNSRAYCGLRPTGVKIEL